MQPTIRLATAANLPHVIALLAHYYTEWDIWQRDVETTVADAIAHPPLGYLLAEVDGQPAGCVLLKSLPNIPTPEAKSVECKRLFVSPNFRGHRLADRLMDAAESAARAAGFDWIYLDTKPEFAAAIALYQRRGYLDCPRYNDNPQATIFMRKSLTSLP